MLRRSLLLGALLLVGCGGGGGVTTPAPSFVGMYRGWVTASGTDAVSGTSYNLIRENGTFQVMIEGTSPRPTEIAGTYSGNRFQGVVTYRDGSTVSMTGTASRNGVLVGIQLAGPDGKTVGIGGDSLYWGRYAKFSLEGMALTALVSEDRVVSLTFPNGTGLSGSFTEGGHFAGNLTLDGSDIAVSGEALDYDGAWPNWIVQWKLRGAVDGANRDFILMAENHQGV